MKTTRAFAGGVVGALAVSAVSGLLRVIGVPINLELMLGSLVAAGTDAAVWLVGLALNLALGGLVGVIYGVLFEKSFHDASIGLGLAIAAVHAVLTGIVLAFVPQFHPLVPELMPAPGPFLLSLGAFGVLLFLALHLMFGAIVASWHGPLAATRRVPFGPHKRIPTR